MRVPIQPSTRKERIMTRVKAIQRFFISAYLSVGWNLVPREERASSVTSLSQQWEYSFREMAVEEIALPLESAECPHDPSFHRTLQPGMCWNPINSKMSSHLTLHKTICFSLFHN